MNIIFPFLRKFTPLGLLASFAATPSVLADTILNSWAGMAMVPKPCGTGLIQVSPPDPHGAAGPSGILQTVNLDIAYFTKAGTIVWGPTDLGSFWSGVNNGGDFDAACNIISGDPKAVYDSASKRFYVIMQENTLRSSFLNVAVSRTENPAGSGSDQWFFYRLDITETRIGARLGGDYPGLGLDSQAMYVTYNMYPLPLSGSPLNSQIIILNKADLNRGVLTYKRLFAPDAISSTLVPASVTGDASPGNKAYFVQVSFPLTIALWVLKDPLGSPTLLPPVELPVLPNGDFPGPGAPQAGTSIRLDTLGEELKAQGNAFWRNGSLWFCYTGGVLFDERTKVYYYRIETHDFPNGLPIVSDQASVDGGDGVWTFQPAIGGNACGDVCLVYCESSAAEFPRIMCAVRPRGASRFNGPFVVKQSPSFYVGTANNPGDPARWGDYAAVSVDPTDGTFWITHEWARSSTGNDWGTWWAQIAVTPPPSRELYVNNSQSCIYHTGAKNCTAIPLAGPYATVVDGVNNALCGDFLNIRAGSYHEQLTITKALRIQTYDGAVIIGR